MNSLTAHVVLTASSLLPSFAFSQTAVSGADPASPASVRPAWQDRLERFSTSPDAWRARSADIRTQILVAAGLWPSFERPPVKPVIFGKIERDGYTVEKVHFESWPGFHLTGNLYRPLGKTGPFPAMLAAHGHWALGRFQDNEETSVPGRAISLARLGFVVFSYDMVGFGDLTQLTPPLITLGKNPHNDIAFFNDPPWGLNLLGLQLWDSMRAVDFLCSLPDVDAKRIGVTGESGGGTQTYLVAAVDDRIACSVPVCMVAAVFQGDCTCEVAPSLRVDLNNVEIAASIAPRPLLLISATGDWTQTCPTVEAPAIREVYKKLGAPERFACVQFDAPHNYRKDSREAVYAWLVRQLMRGASGLPATVARKDARGADIEIIPEPPYTVEKREDLAVFGSDHPRPAGLLDEAGLEKSFRDEIRAQLDCLQPRDAATLAHFRSLMTPALQCLLATRWPAKSDVKAIGGEIKNDCVLSSAHASLRLHSNFLGELNMLKSKRRVVVLVAPESFDCSQVENGLIERGTPVVTIRGATPAAGYEAAAGNPSEQAKFRDCYFPTLLGVQVDSILSSLAYLSGRVEKPAICLVGLGQAGIPTLLARALVPENVKIETTLVDVAGVSDADAASWTGERAQPGILRIGGLRTATTLAAAGPGKLILHNTQGKFDAREVADVLKAAGRPQALTISEEAFTAGQILEALR